MERIERRYLNNIKKTAKYKADVEAMRNANNMRAFDDAVVIRRDRQYAQSTYMALAKG